MQCGWFPWEQAFDSLASQHHRYLRTPHFLTTVASMNTEHPRYANWQEYSLGAPVSSQAHRQKHTHTPFIIRRICLLLIVPNILRFKNIFSMTYSYNSFTMFNNIKIIIYLDIRWENYALQLKDISSINIKNKTQYINIFVTCKKVRRANYFRKYGLWI